MRPRLREAIHQALTMAVLMFLLRRLMTMLPADWAQQSLSGSLVFALAAGAMWGWLAWLQHPRIEAHRAAMTARAKERKKAAQRARWR